MPLGYHSHMVAPDLIPEGQDNFELSDLTPFLQKAFDNALSPRAKINRERAVFLSEDSSFHIRLEQIRKENQIPHLTPEKDIYVVEIPMHQPATSEAFSFYLEQEIGRASKIRIEKALKSVLVEYGLPLNFYEWVQYFLLYRKRPSGIPRYNWELIDQLAENPDEAKRIPLSFAEKKWWLWIFRSRVGIKEGRIPKKFANAYSELKSILNSATNKLRRSRTYDSALEVLESKARRIDTLDKAGHKKTYRDVVADLTSLETEEEFRKEADKFRQRTSRLLNRAKGFKKPER